MAHKYNGYGVFVQGDPFMFYYGLKFLNDESKGDEDINGAYVHCFRRII